MSQAKVIIDESGSLEFKWQLAKYLRRKINTEDRRIISEVKMQNSGQNNLLQLADYVSGVINRSVQGNKKFADDYRRLIAHRQMYVQIWPR